MAGMPPALIIRANEVLQTLEQSRENNNKDTAKALKNVPAEKVQLSIFDAHSLTFQEIRELLETVDINRLTPVEALLKLQEIKQKIQ